MLTHSSMKYGFVVLSLVLSLFSTTLSYTQPLKVCATVPELGSLVHEIGGDQVAISVFAKGTEDPHFVIPKPSFIKALSQCDVYVQIGFDLEVGWVPPLLLSSRNAQVQTGGRGYIDASVAVAPLEVPAITVDRSMGDLHPLGNPHYLLSPTNGCASPACSATGCPLSVRVAARILPSITRISGAASASRWSERRFSTNTTLKSWRS